MFAAASGPYRWSRVTHATCQAIQGRLNLELPSSVGTVTMPTGGGLPWQVRAFAGGGQHRMPAYKAAMVLGLGGAAWWWFSTKKDLEQKQAEAVDRFGEHGEKVRYGDDATFKAGVHGEHFPGLPTADTNAPGGHAGGTKP